MGIETFMTRNFIPPIGKYYSLKENAMFTRIKLSAWTFIILCVIMITALLMGEDSISVPVQPTFDFTNYDSSFARYGENTIRLSGKLEIVHPSLTQKMLMPVSLLEMDVLNCLLIITMSILVLRLLPHIHSTVLFQKDISPSIRSIGFALIIFWLLDLLRIFYFTIPEISRLTNNQFIYQKNGFTFIPVPFWLGLTVLWISRVYKNAFTLKKEQELTI